MKVGILKSDSFNQTNFDISLLGKQASVFVVYSFGANGTSGLMEQTKYKIQTTWGILLKKPIKNQIQ